MADNMFEQYYVHELECFASHVGCDIAVTWMASYADVSVLLHPLQPVSIICWQKEAFINFDDHMSHTS